MFGPLRWLWEVFGPGAAPAATPARVVCARAADDGGIVGAAAMDGGGVVCARARAAAEGCCMAAESDFELVKGEAKSIRYRLPALPTDYSLEAVSYQFTLAVGGTVALQLGSSVIEGDDSEKTVTVSVSADQLAALRSTVHQQSLKVTTAAYACLLSYGTATVIGTAADP